MQLDGVLTHQVIDEIKQNQNNIVCLRFKIKDKVVEKHYRINVTKKNKLELKPVFFDKKPLIPTKNKLTHACYNRLQKLSKKSTPISSSSSAIETSHVRRVQKQVNRRITSKEKQYYQVDVAARKIKSEWHKNVLYPSVTSTHDDRQTKDEQLLDIPVDYEKMDNKNKAALFDLVQNTTYIDDMRTEQKPQQQSHSSDAQVSPIKQYSPTYIELSSSPRKNWTTRIKALAELKFSPVSGISTTTDGYVIEKEQRDSLLLQSKKKIQQDLEALKTERTDIENHYFHLKAVLVKKINAMKETLQADSHTVQTELVLRQMELNQARADVEHVSEQLSGNTDQSRDMSEALALIKLALG